MLNGWRGSLDDPNYPGDWVHVEWDTLSGAVIRDNIHGLFAQWGRSHHPLDVFCVSGINNVMDFIMREYQALKDTIQAICPDDPTGPVATLLMPPKLTTINKGFSGHIPEDDKTDFIKELNSRIIDFNKQHSMGQDGSVLAPKFDTRTDLVHATRS